MTQSPPPTALQIRDFFSQLLQKHYSLPRDTADALVRPWLYGQEKEIMSYDLDTYRALFGPEIGAILYGRRSEYGKERVKERVEALVKEHADYLYIIKEER
ncbi:hypothetical protein PZA11_002158 [Diplocarpon coronariae]|nr:hypothetical protein JHW43_006787 [Diplocarpon mali]